jgi:hypothetical protein
MRSIDNGELYPSNNSVSRPPRSLNPKSASSNVHGCRVGQAGHVSLLNILLRKKILDAYPPSSSSLLSKKSSS